MLLIDSDSVTHASCDHLFKYKNTYEDTDGESYRFQVLCWQCTNCNDVFEVMVDVIARFSKSEVMNELMDIIKENRLEIPPQDVLKEYVEDCGFGPFEEKF